MERSPKQIATELLALKAQSGDMSAFDALYRLWMPVLLGRCLRQLRKQADAEDSASKVWLKAMRNIQKIRDPACFAAWLLRIGHVTCVDIIRKQSRQQNIREELPDDECLPEYSRSAKIDLGQAILQLPEIQQQVLDLHYTIGFSIGEIAYILETKPGMIKSRLHTACQTLKTKLETGENHE